MAEFTGQYVLGLEPKKEVYDVSESHELAIRVFPNGIKTWVFLFKVGEFERSRTLGIFPDMSPQQARDEVPTARKIATLARDFEKRVELVGSNTAVIKEEAATDSAIKKGNRNAWAAGLAAVASLSALLALIISQHEPATTAAPSASNINADVLRVENYPRELPTIPIPALASLRVDVRHRSVDLEPDWLRLDFDPRQIILASRESTPQHPVAATNKRATQTQDGMLVIDPKIKRAQFASDVRDREPVDKLETVQVVWSNPGAKFFYYFSEFVDAGGESFSHNWYLDNQLQSTVDFHVRSSHRWRVYSKKRITPTQLGQWRVDTINAQGQVLNSESFVLLGERRLANNP